MIYTLTFFKDFGNHSGIINGDFEWAVYGSTNRNEVIQKAKKANQNPMINFTTERWRVWEGKTKKFSLKSSRLIFDGINEL
jgi:hypothetical protein